MRFAHHYLTLTPLLLVAIWGGATTQDVSAQTVVVDRGVRYPRRIYWGAYDPYYAVTSRVVKALTRPPSR